MLGLTLDAPPEVDAAAWPRQLRYEVEAPVGLARWLARFSVLMEQAVPGEEPTVVDLICGRCGRLMANDGDWYTLPMDGAHRPTAVCAPCRAVATVTVH